MVEKAVALRMVHRQAHWLLYWEKRGISVHIPDRTSERKNQTTPQGMMHVCMTPSFSSSSSTDAYAST